MQSIEGGFVGFSGTTRVGEGRLMEVAAAAWLYLQAYPTETVLTFNRMTGDVVDLNLTGTLQDVTERYAEHDQPSGKRGRPKLGVVAREITLLPRHWEWLARQPGGASVALRRLVDEARKSNTVDEASRERISAAYKFMSAMAGDLPLFEEAARMLFARRREGLVQCIAKWPADLKEEIGRFTSEIVWAS